MDKARAEKALNFHLQYSMVVSLKYNHPVSNSAFQEPSHMIDLHDTSTTFERRVSFDTQSGYRAKDIPNASTIFHLTRRHSLSIK